MGYLRRPIRRKRARVEKFAHLNAARTIDPAQWTTCIDLCEVPSDTFLRFIVHHHETGWTGLFRSNDLIEQDDSELPPSVKSRLRSVYRWFDQNLIAPRGIVPAAIFWFRADASQCIDQLRELIEIFRMDGHHVFMQATTEPGVIVHRDANQIAALVKSNGRITTSKW